MPSQEQISGGQRRPTAQEMAGGVPQNALQTTGRFLKDFFNPFTLPGDNLPRSDSIPPQSPPVNPPGIGEFLNPLSAPPGSKPPAPSFQPPPVSQAQAPDLAMQAPPAAAPPAPIAPAMQMGGGGPPMGAMGGPPMGAPTGQGNPAMLAALMQRMQGGR